MKYYRSLSVFAFLTAVILLVGGCASVSREGARGDESASKAAESIAATFGVEIVSIRLTAAGHMIDLRYRVNDPGKAVLFLARSTKMYMIDKETGEKLAIPRTMLGPMRQSSVKPLKGRVYFVLFGNRDGVVREGSRVEVVVGDQKIEDLVIQ